MRKQMFTFILVLMTFSILGIAVLEWYWVSNAIREKSEAFDLSVRRAMNDVVAELEVDAAENLIQETFHGLDFSNSYKGFTPSQWKTDTSYLSASGMRNFIVMRDSFITIDIESGTYENQIKGQYKIPTPGTHTTQWVKGVDTVSLADIRRNQGVLSTAMRQVLVKQIRKEPSIKETAEGKNIDSLLTAHLRSNGVIGEFEYGLASSERDSVIVEYSRSRNVNPENFEYRASLFPGQPSEAVMLLDFPEKGIYIIRSLGGLMALVLLFSILMLTTFGTTVYYIMRQKKLNDVKTDFINNMTHEFKTPLATIGLAVDSIRHPQVMHNPTEISHLTGIIAQEKTRLTGHVEKILQLARLERGDLIIHKKPENLNELVTQAIASMKLQVEAREATIQFAADSDIAVIMCDKEHLTNVVVNLLDNALKYSGEKSVVEVSTELKSGCVLLLVKDRGIGMSSDEQKHIFEAFYRVQRGDLHNVKGFGLGLSYAQGVIRLHGGDMILDSKRGRGTTIGFKIPL